MLKQNRVSVIVKDLCWVTQEVKAKKQNKTNQRPPEDLVEDVGSYDLVLILTMMAIRLWWWGGWYENTLTLMEWLLSSRASIHTLSISHCGSLRMVSPVVVAEEAGKGEYPAQGHITKSSRVEIRALSRGLNCSSSKSLPPMASAGSRLCLGFREAIYMAVRKWVGKKRLLSLETNR